MPFASNLRLRLPSDGAYGRGTMGSWFDQQKQRRNERIASWIPFVVVFAIPAAMIFFFLD